MHKDRVDSEVTQWWEIGNPKLWACNITTGFANFQESLKELRKSADEVLPLTNDAPNISPLDADVDVFSKKHTEGNELEYDLEMGYNRAGAVISA